MKVYIFVFICLFAESYGCFRSSQPTSNATTTTTTTTPKPWTTTKLTTKAIPKTATTVASLIDEEEIRALDISESEAQKPGQPGQPGHKSGVEVAELRTLSEELYKLDKNSIGSSITLNYQGKVMPNNTNDMAPLPLFSEKKAKVKESRTIELFKKILDNYEPSVKTQEDNTHQEIVEINAFLDSAVTTDVMKKTEEFLTKKGLIVGKLRPALYHIWFTPYSRSKNVVGSSGFEHVFLGEVKEGKVSGFHNWIFFEKQEQENHVNYKGYLKTLNLGDKGEILKIRFDWMNHPKAVGSMFIGTSPELEMALYTVCFYARPNAGCNLQMNGERFRMKVYTQVYGDKKVIGSAYPEIF